MSDQHRRVSFVYLIKATGIFRAGAREDSLLKVGMSDNPAGRLASFATACPFKIELVKTWKLPTRAMAYQIEHDVHEKYRECRLAGEWFHHLMEDMIYGIDRTIFNWILGYPNLDEKTLLLFMARIGITRANAESFIFEHCLREAA